MAALTLTAVSPLVDHPLNVFAARGSGSTTAASTSAPSKTPIRRQPMASAPSSPASPPVAYRAAVLADQPLIYYRLDDAACCTAMDSSSHGVNGTYAASGITYGAPGLLTGDGNAAIVTAATGAAATAGDSTLPSGGARTVDLWEKSTSAAWQSFLSYGVGNGGQLFMVSTRGPSFVDLIGYNVDAQFATPYPINDGKAHHIAMTYDGGVTVTAYLDGQQIGQSALSSALTTTLGSGLQVGGGLDGPFTGTLDEVAFYAGALTAIQINAHWRAGVNVGCPATPTTGYAGVVAADNPVRQFRLGETSGRAALDFSSNCRAAAYAYGATHVTGLLSGDSDGAVGSPTPAGTIVNASADGLPKLNDARTVEFWEQTTSTAWQTYLSYGVANGGQLFMASTRGPSLLDLIGYGVYAQFATPYPLNDGNPHHVALTYDGGVTVTAYLDGQQIGQGALQSALGTQLGGQGLMIGNGIDGPFVGTMDEVSIYLGALSPSRINEHWQAGVAAAACPAVPTTGYAGAIVANSPVRYFRLGETSGHAAVDSSGNCRAGAYAPGVTHVGGLIAGDRDGAVGSPTPAGTIVSSTAAGLPAGATPRTVDLWEQTTSTAWQTFLSYGYGNGGQYFMVSTRGTGFLDLISYNNDAQFTTPYPINDGRPHHLAITYDGGQIVTAYVDGQQIGQLGLPSALATQLYGQGLMIGNGIDGPFVGTLDEVAIYPTALTAAQIGTIDDASGTVIAGTVLDGTTPMAGAVVEVCTGVSGATCLPQTVTTTSSGVFLLRPPPGSYGVTAFPSPTSVYPAPLTVGPVSVPPSARNVKISFTAPLPASGTFNGQQGISPTVNWAQPSTYAVTGCKKGYGFLVILATNRNTGQPDSMLVPFVETPYGSGNYVAQIPPLAPLHGAATVAQLIACPGARAVIPSGGPPAGGTKVILNVGASNGQVTAVNFGSRPAASFKSLTHGFWMAVSPPGTDQTTVSVSTTTNPSLTLGPFTYTEITGLGSTSGPADGGNTIVINGTGFIGVQAVTFDGVPSPSFTVDSPTQITATVPPGLGQVNVQVLLGGATGGVATGITLQDIYNFVGNISPKLIAGLSAFLISSVLRTRGYPLIARLVVGSAAGQIQGLAEGDVVSGLIEAYAGDAFAFAWRFLASDVLADFAVAVLFSPYLLVGLTAVAIGLGVALIFFLLFVDPSGTVVDTLGNPLNGATATLLRQSTPAGGFVPVQASSGTIVPAVNPQQTGASGAFHWDAIAGAYQVQASASGCSAPGNPGQPVAATPAFVIPPEKVGLLLMLACPPTTSPAPTVTAMSLHVGSPAGGTSVLITGTALAGATAVRFGGTPASSVTVLSPYALVVTAPAGSSMVDVTVTTPGGTSAVAAEDRFFYAIPATAPGAPTINSLSSINGPVVGGNTVTIYGANLGVVSSVTFGSNPATDVIRVSDTQLLARVPATLLEGRVDVTAYNTAGQSALTSADAYYYGSAIPTTLTLASSANPSAYGQAVSFQATVTTGATGTVQFAVDGANLGSPVALSGGQATPPGLATLGVGSHAVSATYAGDAGFLGSRGSLTQTVNKAATSTTVASSQNPSIVNNPVTFTASVAPNAPGAGSPSGTVQFTANGANLGAPVALAGGQASLTTSALARGHYTITATYSGDGNFTTSASPAITQAVRNNLIVFSSTRDGNLQLYSMRPDGTGQTRLTNNPAQDSEPILSPDGTQVAFTSTRGGGLDIYEMKTAPEGSTNVPRSLTNRAAVNADPTWSKDGTRIVFASTRTGRSQLWITNADGTGTATRLTNDTANDINPALSPDGTKLAYSSNVTGRFQLYVATLTASLTIASTARLTNDTAYDTTPAWSGDSRLIAFTGTASGNLEIWVIPAQGGTAIRETSNPGSADFGPSWSPDGKTMAFTHGTGTVLAVYSITYNATGLGTGQAALTTANTSELPNWCCAAAP